jgi:lysozyme
VDKTKLQASLVDSEALRLKVYDDATGKPVVKGYTMIGNPTIGIGRNLAEFGITMREAYYLNDNDIELYKNLVLNNFPYVKDLDDVRQNVIIELMFNIGPARLSGFKKMHNALIAKDYKGAATELRSSLWFSQVGKRGPKLADALESGLDLQKYSPK